MTMRLYDLAGANDLRFSPYCFRAKMAFASKGLAVETVATRYCDIPTIGDGSLKALPVLEHDGRFVADSFAIALYLDATFPDRPLLPKGPDGLGAARYLEGAINLGLGPLLLPSIGLAIHDHLDPVDQAYFRRTREARMGMTLEEGAATTAARSAGIPKALAPLKHALTDRPFLGGETPTYLDAIPYGTMAWAKVFGVDPIGDDPVLAPWYARCHDAATSG